MRSLKIKEFNDSDWGILWSENGAIVNGDSISFLGTIALGEKDQDKQAGKE